MFEDLDFEKLQKLSEESINLIEKYMKVMPSDKVIEIMVTVITGAAFGLCEDEEKVKEVITLSVNQGILLNMKAREMMNEAIKNMGKE